ncbi:hypothetical protein [Photobacterium marinum]|uniref:hypothetical protein n=1 Tax=Photobacterium marinum TaxID=1056511 RepID=UPI0005611B85|nr:hypothetical protein [Photobacterium marinum]
MNKRVRKEIKFPDLVGRRITRHEEKRDFLLSSLVTRPDLLTEFNNVLNTAIAADGLGERDELTVQYFQLALELGVAHFISAFELPVDYEVTYLGTTYPYSKKALEHPGIQTSGLIYSTWPLSYAIMKRYGYCAAFLLVGWQMPMSIQMKPTLHLLIL